MFSYLGIDNLQCGKLVLICKSCNGLGVIKEEWRDTLPESPALSSFFDHLRVLHPTLTFATTHVAHDPGGVVAKHHRQGGRVVRYYKEELDAPRFLTARKYQTAEQLVTKVIVAEQFPAVAATVQNDLDVLATKIAELALAARMIREQVTWLSDQNLKEIPF